MLFRCTVVLFCLVRTASTVFYDTFTGEIVSDERLAELRRLNLIPWCAIDIADCSPNEGRRLDGSCNNLKHPPRGATLTPYSRLLPPAFGQNSSIRRSKFDSPLPNARALRVALISDGRTPSPRFTQLLVYKALLVVSDTTSIHDTVNYAVMTLICCTEAGRNDPRCLPIEVSPRDVYLRFTNVRCLNLTRSFTYQRIGCVPNTIPAERVNTAPPLLELSFLYGSDAERIAQSREGYGGLLRMHWRRGREWPPNTNINICINNVPPLETRCHEAPNLGSNSVISINVLFIWYYRNHNRLARSLQALNPCWDDERLFLIARDINIAYYQHIVYYELMTLILGREYLMRNGVIFETTGYVKDYDDTLEPRVSIDFINSYRWFHNMQEGRMKLYNNGGKLLDELEFVNYTLRTGALPINNTIEGFTQGSFRQPSADADYFVDPDMGQRVLGPLQFVSDVVASDIMKGRDTGLPPYNKYRELCRLPVAHSFEDLLQWMPQEQVDALERSYESVDDVELMPGIQSERLMEGATVGPTLACIMTLQLQHWRRSDRFWFENSVHPGALTLEQLSEVRRMTMSRLICDVGDDVTEIQPHAFLLPGKGNKFVDCSRIEAPNLEPWRDGSCSKPLSDHYNPFSPYTGLKNANTPSSKVFQTLKNVLI